MISRGLIAGYLLVAFHLLADPLDDWTWRNPLPTGNALRAVAYGGGNFVAVGEVGAILVSQDALNWSGQRSPTTTSLGAITYGGGRFVALGPVLIDALPTIITSCDATNWIAAAPGTTNTLFAVGFGNSTFVAVGENETIVTSSDGTNWVKRHETPFGNRFVGVAYGNGLFIVTVSGSGSVLVSSNGVNWTSRPAFGFGFGRITFGNGVFLARNTTFIGPTIFPRLAISTDGTSWSVCAVPASASAAGIFTYDSTKFVLLGTDSLSQSNVLCTSVNGSSWTTNFVQGPPSPLIELAFGSGQYVGVAGTASSKILASPDLLNWIRIGSSLPLSAARMFLSGNGKYVLAGDGPILVSTNGIDYQTNATTGTFSAGAFGTDSFILTAGGGSIVTSTNGSNWTTRSTGGSSLNELAYGSNTFIAVGGNGDIRVSPNGSSWSGRFSGVTLELKSVTYGNGIFVVVGAGGTILTSPDTITWTSQDSGTTATLTSVAFGNNIFFAVNGGGTIFESSDGVGWTPVASGASQLLRAAVNRGNLLVAGFGTVFSSVDGIQWRSRRVPLSNVGAIGTTAKTFILLGESAGVIESGELSPIALFQPEYNAATGFHLKATGETGMTARLQRSADFVNWNDVLTFTNSGERIPLHDSSATNSIRSFYRVVAP